MEKEVNLLEKSNLLKLSLYLGCVIPNRYPMIEKATRTLFNYLGIEIKEMNGASCCPAPGVFRSVDKALWISVAARNICIAQNNDADLVTLCNGCYGTLLEVDHKLKTNQNLANRVNEVLKEANYHYDGKIRVRHIMDILYNEIGIDKIKSLVKRKLNWRVAVHYGCHLIKPSNIRPFKDDPNEPKFFDEIVEAAGFQSINYRDKFLCCGAGGAVRTFKKDLTSQLTLKKLREIRKALADCIVVCCPFCHLQFDLGQVEVKSILDENEPSFNIPVLYITQLLGLAFGLEPKELGLIKPENLKNISPFISLQPILDKVEKYDKNENKKE